MATTKAHRQALEKKKKNYSFPQIRFMVPAKTLRTQNNKLLAALLATLICLF